MNKKARQLLKQNNEREKAIHKDNDELYTNMVVYLRGSDMTNYNQELVRSDLIEMILDGQDRGDDIEKVIGSNYKEVCDEIIQTMPKKTAKHKALSFLESSLSTIWIVGAIFVTKTVLANLINGNGNWRFTLSTGELINILIIVAGVNILVHHTCTSAFKHANKNKLISFFKTWAISCVILGIMIISAYYLKYTVLNISLIAAAVIILVTFVLSMIFSRYEDSI